MPEADASRKADEFKQSPVRPSVLVTAGPTAEDIDPVRYLTNRSSGRMGIAVARAVARAGGLPLLVLGPTHLEPPPGVETLRVRSAADMCRAVVDNFSRADALVMAAAVADYTPAEPLDRKLKKADGDLFLRLRRTPDILAAVRDLPGRRGKCVVGFSLDVDINLDEGRRKLRAKGLDFIVVNTTASFASARETAWILSEAEGTDLGAIGKEDLADEIVSRILGFLSRGEADAFPFASPEPS